MNCKVINIFLTSFGKIYVVDFQNKDFTPNFDTKLEYNGDEFRITSFFGLGSHEYYDQLGNLYPNKVWSCVLERINQKENDENIPIGVDLRIVK